MISKTVFGLGAKSSLKYEMFNETKNHNWGVISKVAYLK